MVIYSAQTICSRVKFPVHKGDSSYDKIPSITALHCNICLASKFCYSCLINKNIASVFAQLAVTLVRSANPSS